MAPPLEALPTFKHHKLPLTGGDSESKSSSEGSEKEEDYQDALEDQIHQTQLLSQPSKGDSFTLKSPLKNAIARGSDLEEDTSGFCAYPVFEGIDPAAGQPQSWHEQISFKTLKELKQAGTMYGSIATLQSA
jgi:hypothetical protein